MGDGTPTQSYGVVLFETYPMLQWQLTQGTQEESRPTDAMVGGRDTYLSILCSRNVVVYGSITRHGSFLPTELRDHRCVRILPITPRICGSRRTLRGLGTLCSRTFAGRTTPPAALRTGMTTRGRVPRIPSDLVLRGNLREVKSSCKGTPVFANGNKWGRWKGGVARVRVLPCQTPLHIMFTCVTCLPEAPI